MGKKKINKMSSNYRVYAEQKKSILKYEIFVD